MTGDFWLAEGERLGRMLDRGREGLDEDARKSIQSRLKSVMKSAVKLPPATPPFSVATLIRRASIATFATQTSGSSRSLAPEPSGYAV
ncbi:MAG: hypothetical protein FJY67_07445 [Calditrichaeota bacterium]|nr:hypothetical protein [Calditrichota bacterium]